MCSTAFHKFFHRHWQRVRRTDVWRGGWRSREAFAKPSPEEIFRMSAETTTVNAGCQTGVDVFSTGYPQFFGNASLDLVFRFLFTWLAGWAALGTARQVVGFLVGPHAPRSAVSPGHPQGATFQPPRTLSMRPSKPFMKTPLVPVSAQQTI